MKLWGSVLIVVGLFWGVIAFSMSTSVKSIDGSQVFNLSLADNRNLNITIAGVITVIGTILFGFGSLQSSGNSNPNARKCPFCDEAIQPKALICKHCKSDLSVVIRKNPEYLSEVELNKLIEKLK